MRIAAYKGKSLISKAIRWQTRGKYSHVAVMLDDGRIIEAWHNPAKVRVITSLSEGHTPGTKVDIFEVETTPDQEVRIAEFLLDQVGKKYDFGGVLRFLSRRNKNNPQMWFCSKLAFSCFLYGGIELLKRIEPYQVAPVTMVRSPLLSFIRQEITIDARRVSRR